MEATHVFLSYSRSGGTANAAQLRTDLMKAGVEVWWDKDILPGLDWQHKVREAMKRSSAIILCFSESAVNLEESGMYPEILDAIAAYRERKPGGIYLIPVRFSPCEIPELDIDSTRKLNRLQYGDLFPTDRHRPEQLQRLLAAIKHAASARSTAMIESLPTPAAAEVAPPEPVTPSVPKAPIQSSTVNPEARDALRAYLQRGEVRLSTMHRIGGSFISGAGLLLFLPLFFQTVLSQIVSAFVTTPSSMQRGMPITMNGQDLLIVAIPVILALVIPLIAVWYLLRDLTTFYFSSNIPHGEQLDTLKQEQVFHPRFALTAIPFSDDEGEDVKRKLRYLQTMTQLTRFLLPYRRKEKSWLLKLVESEEGQKIALPEDEWFEGVVKDNELRMLRMAFGLAGAYNRTLIEEVAKTEFERIVVAFCMAGALAGCLAYAKLDGPGVAFVWASTLLPLAVLVKSLGWIDWDPLRWL